jgi:Fic/DOC family
VFDFLCVHPFRDGNGRMSRLLTLLALYQHGDEVGRYISLERLMEDTREDYYDVLQRSSAGWHEGRHDLFPWLNYFLTIVRGAYREFEERVGQVKSPRGGKTALVGAAIGGVPRPVHPRRSGTCLPRGQPRHDPPRPGDLQTVGRVACLGRGPGARWRKEGNTSKRG